jgi:hypothetical protein
MVMTRYIDVVVGSEQESTPSHTKSPVYQVDVVSTEYAESISLLGLGITCPCDRFIAGIAILRAVEVCFEIWRVQELRRS